MYATPCGSSIDSLDVLPWADMKILIYSQGELEYLPQPWQLLSMSIPTLFFKCSGQLPSLQSLY